VAAAFVTPNVLKNGMGGFRNAGISGDPPSRKCFGKFSEGFRGMQLHENALLFLGLTKCRNGGWVERLIQLFTVESTAQLVLGVVMRMSVSTAQDCRKLPQKPPAPDSIKESGNEVHAFQ
jgi:hypothetical protein